MTNTLTLSTAIRLGSLLRPQGFGKYFLNKKSCALGAAFEAMGGQLIEFGMHDGDVRQQFPELARGVRCCWCRNAIVVDMLKFVAHLNDDHKFSREAIADLLEEPGAAMQRGQAQEAGCVGVK